MKLLLSLLIMSSTVYGNLFWSKKSEVEPQALPEITTVTVDGEGVLHLLWRDIKHQNSKGLKVVNGVLEAHLKNNEELYIHLKSFQSISVRGNATVRSEEQFHIPDFSVSASGNGKLFLAIKGKFVNVLVQDQAEVLLSGITDEQHAIVQNHGQYEAGSLFTKIATVTVNGNGKAMVNVSRELTANITGDGLLQYGGDPGIVNKNIQEAGKLKPFY
jgi:Putative auto-transporter adhesin, head GIN domain